MRERRGGPRRFVAMRLLPPALVMAALLAGCDSSSPAPAPSPTVAPGGYVAKVRALPAKQRAGVLLRAIRDADRPCQRVVGEAAAQGGGDRAAWVATCDDKGQWVVVIADDGTATVADAHDVARHAR